MDEEFVASEPIGPSDEPDSPIYDELPVDDSATAPQGDGSCSVYGKKYKNGAMVCGNNRKYQCRNGVWVKISDGSCPPGEDVF